MSETLSDTGPSEPVVEEPTTTSTETREPLGPPPDPPPPARSFGEKFGDWIRKPWVIVLIGLVVVFFLIVGFSYSKINSLHREGTDKETQLTAQYLVNQNELSTYISKFYEQLGITQAKTAALDQVLTDAIKGRYDNNLTPATPGQPQGNQLISALVEAYPNLDQLNAYDRILDTISAGREAYKNTQNVLLDQLRAYDKWRKQNIIGSLFIKIAGFPGDSLKACIGAQCNTGSAAEAQMYAIVLAPQAGQAYTTGTLPPLTVPSSTGS